ncbi:MAG: hypothetical protein LBG75_01350 [Candidatus Nomurabacteria bacterium]|jgi:hypothetical protein|nr:hypothetical protein [Candidatus Nomurabacteria bacterium]
MEENKQSTTQSPADAPMDDGVLGGGNLGTDEAEPKQTAKTEPTHKYRKLSHKKIVIICIIALLVVTVILTVCFAVLNRKDTTPKPSSNIGGSGTELNPETSDASVDSIVKELKIKINKQIAGRENPIDTVQQLTGVLADTTNAKRQEQLPDFILNFLQEHEDALRLPSDFYGTPDQLRVNYWKAGFYLELAYNYQSIMQKKLLGTDGKPRNTIQEQLKYLDLYLAIAQNKANWGEPQVSEEDGHVWYLYSYKNLDHIVAWRQQLEQTGGDQ